MKIRIQLLSDLCTGSGETYNSMIDSDITYDEYGIPYIPARRIKGCIREAALEMMELGLIKEQAYYEIRTLHLHFPMHIFRIIKKFVVH